MTETSNPTHKKKEFWQFVGLVAAIAVSFFFLRYEFPSLFRPPLPEEAKTIPVIENPRRQLKEFNLAGQPRATLSGEEIPCPIYCTGPGDRQFYRSTLPRKDELQIVDRIDVYCGTVNFDSPNSQQTTVHDPMGYDFDSGHVPLVETRAILMDVPYGVYWIEVYPCGYNFAYAKPIEFYGPYRVTQTLNINCYEESKAWIHSPKRPCFDFSDRLGSYTPPDYDCTKDPQPIVFSNLKRAKMNPQTVCIFDQFQNGTDIEPEGYAKDVEQFTNVRALRVSRYQMNGEEVASDSGHFPHLKSFKLE